MDAKRLIISAILEDQSAKREVADMVGERLASADAKAEIENTPEYIRPREAAHYTGISQSTLAKLRMRENRTNGPRFVKLSGCVIYRRSDLDEWIAMNIVPASK